MSKIRVAIAEDNMMLGNIMAEFISRQENMEMVGIAGHGQEALEIIKRETPDVLLLDIIMPYLDGIGVLKEIGRIGVKHPAVIAISAIEQESITRTAYAMGVKYFLLKPFEMKTLVYYINRIGTNREMYSDEKKSRAVKRTAIGKLLEQLGFSTGCQGFLYLCEAVFLASENLTMLNKSVNAIYKKVAALYNTTEARVERDIRFAIEKAWINGRIDLQNEIFGYTINGEKGKPTNALFISQIADKISRENR